MESVFKSKMNMNRWFNHLRGTVASLIYYSRVYLLIQETVCKNKVTILVYHEPESGRFKEHLAFLSQIYHIIALEDLVKAIKDNEWSAIPPKALVITIDDGHKSNFNLLEIFKSHCIRPTIYLTSHIINTNRHFWWKSVSSGQESLKKLPYYQYVDRLRELFSFSFEDEHDKRHALNKSEILKMLDYVAIGSHSKFHPILPNCNEKTSDDEIKSSKKLLEELLGISIKHFAYPNGNYSEREIKILQRCGYDSARTLDFGWNSKKTDRFKLKAFAVSDDATIPELCAQAVGIFPFMRRFLLNRR